MSRPGYVYLMASRRNGTLYLGVTSDLPRRVYQHREQGDGHPAPVGPRILEQAAELVHSVNRYFSSTHSATMPSRQVIFFPSS